MSTKKLRKQLLNGTKERIKPLTSKDFVSSGSTELNMAITGKPNRGYAKGSYTLVVGDSSAGKTILALTMLAEMANNPEFDNYTLVYDATTEDGAQMDIKAMFGSRFASRVRMVRSSTAEEFYYNVDDLIDSGEPFAYVCDSENGLDSEAATKKFKDQKNAHRKGKEVPGSYGDGKARIHSQNIRRVTNEIRKTGSVLVMLSQTRDNIDPMSFETKTRSGGKALRFYAQVEYWIALKQRITVSVRGKNRQIGIVSTCQVKRTRYTGKVRQADVVIYYSVGIDHVEGSIRYLINEGHWKGNGASVTAPEFKFSGRISDLISKIQDKGQEKDLALIVTEVWRDIEERCNVVRKRRYM